MSSVTMKGRINAIDKQISDAGEVISKRERSVRRAERNLEIAEDHLAELENQRDELIIASWGDAPNWQGIFGMSEDASSAMRAYREKYIPGSQFTGSVLRQSLRQNWNKQSGW